VTQESAPSQGETTRRAALAGAGLVGLAGLVSACGGGNSPAASPASPAAKKSAGGKSGGSGSGSGGSAATLTETSAIPVGGGKIFSAQKVVVTQPSAGDFKAFSAVCTHQGCIVNQISQGNIVCPCHGSQFSIKNGSVVAGPAPRPLPTRTIKVAGDKITLA
jgi:Rieske Fe-S protein